MKRVAILTASVLALSAFSATAAEMLSADEAAAKTQLAAQLGVDADAVTYKQLIQLNCKMMGAETEGEKSRLLAGLGGAPTTDPSGDDAVQLAAEIGVSPNDYTLSQLVYMKGLIEGRNCTVQRAAEMAKVGEDVSPGGAAAKEQLAMILGVEPTEYTLNELVKMKWSVEGHREN